MDADCKCEGCGRVIEPELSACNGGFCYPCAASVHGVGLIDLDATDGIEDRAGRYWDDAAGFDETEEHDEPLTPEEEAEYKRTMAELAVSIADDDIPF